MNIQINNLNNKQHDITNFFFYKNKYFFKKKETPAEMQFYQVTTSSPHLILPGAIHISAVGLTCFSIKTNKKKKATNFYIIYFIGK